MTQSSSVMIIEFAKSTQNVCMCLAIATVLIIIFMMTPLNTFLISSIFGKVIVLTLLGYILYYNVNQTNKISTNFNVSVMSGNWDALKTNIVCSHLFSAFLLVLILSVIRIIFQKSI
jgi:hypothetical protein